MPVEALLANIDRAGDHAVVLGALVGVGLVGALIFLLIRFVVRTRAARTDRRPDA